jgi:acetyltransferase-like isoleucine patch superfamily enzyme
VIDPTARVHPTADVEDDVEIGAATAIWHRAQVRAGARLGAECIVGKDVFIDLGVQIGDRVKIQNGALVYHGVTVEDGVFIGPGAILTNDRNPRAVTTSGELARDDDWTIAPVALRTGSSIGAGAVVVAGCEVGAYALVGAGAIVTRDVAPHALVVGNPGRRIGWVCDCGRRLRDAATGAPAPASAGLGAVFECATCERRYTYVPDPEGIVEVPAGAPAGRSA